jgi:hypothetical protein
MSLGNKQVKPEQLDSRDGHACVRLRILEIQQIHLISCQATWIQTLAAQKPVFDIGRASDAMPSTPPMQIDIKKGRFTLLTGLGRNRRVMWMLLWENELSVYESSRPMIFLELPATREQPHSSGRIWNALWVCFYTRAAL